MSAVFALNRALGQLARTARPAASAQIAQPSAGETALATTQWRSKVISAANQVQQAGESLAMVVQAVASDPRQVKARGQQLMLDTRETLKQVRAAVDPREVAGGLAGLTVGEVLGGAVGGVAGAAVAGPAGAIVGAEVGAFAASTLGLKFGTDAVRDFVGTREPGVAAAPEAPGGAVAVDRVRRKGRDGYGAVAGLAAGAAVGRAAGPRGLLFGAALGRAIGGRIGRDAAGAARNPAQPPQIMPGASAAQWLDRFGKNTVGEAATVLIAGTIGSIFGPGGRAVGQRLGIIVGSQVAWDQVTVITRATTAGSPGLAPGGSTATADGGAFDGDQQALAPIAMLAALPESMPDKQGDQGATQDLAESPTAGASPSTFAAGKLTARDFRVLSLVAASMHGKNMSA